MPDKSPSIGVVGGGMLGLTLALRLAQRGCPVTLFESAPSLGGLTASHTHDGIVWDRFYHVIEASDEHVLALLAELGLSDDLVWGVTKTNFFDGKALYPLNDVIDYVRLPALNLLDKTRLGLNIVYGAAVKDGVALEAMTAEQWLVRWSGRRTYEKLWRPLLRSKLGDNVDHASAAFIWAVIRRFYGARQGKRKTELFGYVAGGYARVIDALAMKLENLGVHIEMGAPVNAVTGGHNGVSVTTPNGPHRFDRVVATVPSPIATAVCEGLGPAEVARHEAIRYQGVVCPSVLLKRPLGNAYLTYITDDSIPFTTVIEMSSLVDRKQLGGYHLAYLPRYVPSTHPILDASDDEVKAQLLPGLLRMFPDVDDSDIVDFRVARARHVAAIATLNYSSGLPAIATQVPGLYIYNSAQIINASLSVNETVDTANRAVDQVLA